MTAVTFTKSCGMRKFDGAGRQAGGLERPGETGRHFLDPGADAIVPMTGLRRHRASSN